MRALIAVLGPLGAIASMVAAVYQYKKRKIARPENKAWIAAKVFVLVVFALGFTAIAVIMAIAVSD